MWLQMEGICWELRTGPDKSCGADEGTLSCSMLLPHTVGLLGGETAHEALRCWGPKSQGLSQLAHFCTSKFQGTFLCSFPHAIFGSSVPPFCMEVKWVMQCLDCFVSPEKLCHFSLDLYTRILTHACKENTRDLKQNHSL